MQEKTKHQEAQREASFRGASTGSSFHMANPQQPATRGDLMKKMREDEAKRIQQHPTPNSGKMLQYRAPSITTLQALQQKTKEDEAKRIAETGSRFRPQPAIPARQPQQSTPVFVNLTMDQIKQKTREEEAKRIQMVNSIYYSFLSFMTLFRTLKKWREKD